MTKLERRLRPRERWRSERRQRLHDIWDDARWWVILAGFVTAMWLGYVGFGDYLSAVGGPSGTWDILYRDLQLFILESGALSEGSAVPGTLQVARVLAPVMAVVFLHQTLAPLFQEQLQLLRLRRAHGHVVVCGLGNRGLALSRSLREAGYRVVAVEQDPGLGAVGACRSAGVPVVIGDATDLAMLRRVGVSRAGGLVALCGDDGVNAKIAAGAQRLALGRTTPLLCYIHLFEPELCALLETRQLSRSDRASVRLEFFNTFERGAQAMLLRHRPFADQDAEDRGDPHVLVVGLGWLGESLVVQAAQNWHAGHPARRGGLRVTVVDVDAAAKVASLRLRVPRIVEACELQAVELDVRSPEFGQGAFLDPHGERPVSAAYVCLDDDPLCLTTALVLHARLRELGVPIVMRALTADGLPALLGAPTDDEFEALRAFPLIERVCDPELIFGGSDEIIARALHDVYLQRREAEGWRFGPVRDDERRISPSMAPWEDLDEALRAANRDQAAHTEVKLAAVGCQLEASSGWETPLVWSHDEVELLAALEHKRWVRDQTGHGWTLGPSDLPRHQSPSFVPWADLPDDIREYDREFVRSLPVVLAKVGYRIVRVDGGPSAQLPDSGRGGGRRRDDGGRHLGG